MILNPLLCDFPLIVQTPRLILRPPQAGDGRGVHAAKADRYEDFVYWLGWPSVQPSVEADEIEARMLHAKFILREDIRYLVLNRETQEIMGRFAFPSVFIDWRVPAFGISYFMAHRFQKQGYVTEAANALTRVAFDVLKARRVEIRTDVKNIASRYVAERLGYELEAKQRGICSSNHVGDELPEVWTYAIFGKHPLPDLEIEIDPCAEASF